MTRLALKVHDLFLQPDNGCPFLLQQPFILLTCWRVKGGFGQVQLGAQGLGGVGIVAGGEVGDERLVAVSTPSASDYMSG